MRWNWTQSDWPNFTWDATALEALERQFLLASGEIVGAVRHISDREQMVDLYDTYAHRTLRSAAVLAGARADESIHCVAQP